MLDTDEEPVRMAPLMRKTCPYRFMAQLPLAQLAGRAARVVLPPQQGAARPTMVLDVDETLVSVTAQPRKDADFCLHACDTLVYVKKRPHCDEFLARAALLYELVTFSAARRDLSDAVLDAVDPHRRISHRLYREQVGGNFLKDLRVLGRDLRCTFLADNSPQTCALQMDNGIPVRSWLGNDPHDRELVHLLELCTELHRARDVRVALRMLFRTRERVRDVINH
jgi:CTD small phosphatase-like protein 2